MTGSSACCGLAACDCLAQRPDIADKVAQIRADIAGADRTYAMDRHYRTQGVTDRARESGAPQVRE